MKKTDKSTRPAKKSVFHKIRKIVLWILAVLIVIAGLITLASYYYGTKIVKDYLVSSVEKGSKGLYQLKMKSLYFNLLTGNVVVSGFEITPDTVLYNKRQKTDTLAPTLFSIKIDKFQVHGLDLMKLARGKMVEIQQIVIGKPEITVIAKQASKKTEKKEANPKMLSIALPKALKSIHIREIQLNDGKMTFDNRTVTPEEIFSIPSVNIKIVNILVDAVHTGMKRILNADDIRISLKGMKIITKNKMYTITPGEIGLSTGSSTVWVRDLKISPNFSNLDFSRKLGYQMDRMDISVKKVDILKIDFRKLIISHKLIAGQVVAEGLNMEDYRDKRVPMRPGFMPLLPQQALLKAKMYIKIDSISLVDGKVTYSEQVAAQPGSLYFDKMAVTVRNVTNDSVLVSQKTVMDATASMYLMGKGLLNVKLNLPLGAKNDAFSFSATLQNMDLTVINPMLTKLVPAKITGGNVTRLLIPYVSADNDKAIGKMEFSYKGLQVEMKGKPKDTWSKIKAGAVTFIANTYVKNENPTSSGKFTTGIIYFERDKHKSIFNFLWKSAFSGIKSTIGINKKEQKELKKAQKKK